MIGLPYSYALFIFGADRPGIVAEVTAVLYERGLNIEDSSMALLEGLFTAVLIASADRPGLAEPLAAALGGRDYRVSVQSCVPARGPAGLGVRLCVRAYGADRTGIVYQVSRLLADHRANIVNLRSHRIAAEHPVYVLVLDAEVAAAESAAVIHDELARLGAELGIRITSDRVEAAEL